MTASGPTGCFRRFLAYALDYKGLLVLAVLGGGLKFSLSYVFPWITGSAIDHVIRPRDQAGPLPAIDQRMHWLWVLVAAGVFVSVLHGLATYARGYYTAKLGNRIIADLRQDLFDHLHRLSLHFYSRERTGAIVSRLITDIQTAAQIVNGGIVSLVMDLSSILIGLALLLNLSWKLTLASMVIMPLYAFTYKSLNPRVKKASLRVQSQLSKISGNVQEQLAGIALVKTYAAETREREQFHTDTEEHFDRVLQQTSLSQLVNAASEILVHLGQIIVIGFGGYLALHERLTPGQVVQCIGYLAVMYLPVRRFAEINVVYQTSLASLERVFEVFDITPKIVEKATAIRQSPEHGVVVFEHVSFHYHDDSDESRVSLEDRGSEAAQLRALEKRALLAAAGATPGLVLDDICFTASPGQRLALVGTVGLGQVDARVAVAAPVRRGGRPDSDRRARRSRLRPAGPAAGHRNCAAGLVSVFRQRPPEHRVRPAQCQRRRSHRGGAGGQCTRVHPRPARWL